MALDDNPGDYDAFVICYNGDGSHFNFGVFMLYSPRYVDKFYIVQVWAGRPHAACITNNVNLSGYATQDWVNSNFSNVKATLVGSNLGKMLSLSTNDSLSTILSRVGDGESLYGRFNAAMRFLTTYSAGWGQSPHSYDSVGFSKIRVMSVGESVTATLKNPNSGNTVNCNSNFSPFHNRFYKPNSFRGDWVYPENYGFVQSGGMEASTITKGTHGYPQTTFKPTARGVWILWLALDPGNSTWISMYQLIIAI